MRKMATVAALAAFALASTAAVSGCFCPFGGDVAEQAAEEAVEEATGVDVEEDGDSVTITGGEEGDEFSMSSGDELPDDFPSDFPVYEGRIEGSTSFASDEGDSFTVAVVTDDDMDDIKAFFEAEFAANGWNIDFQMSGQDGDGGETMSYTVSKGENTGGVSVGLDMDGNMIVTHTVYLTE